MEDKKIFVRIKNNLIADKLEVIQAVLGKSLQETIGDCILIAFDKILEDNPSKKEEITNYLEALDTLRESNLKLKNNRQ